MNLNEPLGNILGFCAVGKEVPRGFRPQLSRISEKIEAASLRAREIIQKLLVFARQKPPEK